jgi:protein-disulfide isomerase
MLAALGGTTLGTALLSGTAQGASAADIVDAPVDAVRDATYGTMATDPDAPTFTLYGNFKCPFTRDFILNYLPEVMTEYVEPGDLKVRYRSLVWDPQDHSDYYISNSDDNIAQSALGVWTYEPENYWRYVYDLFENQPSGYWNHLRLADRMRSVGVRNWGKIRNDIPQQTFIPDLEETLQVSTAYDQPFTPRAVLGGEMENPRRGLFDWIESHI